MLNSVQEPVEARDRYQTVRHATGTPNGSSRSHGLTLDMLLHVRRQFAPDSSLSHLRLWFQFCFGCRFWAAVIRGRRTGPAQTGRALFTLRSKGYVPKIASCVDQSQTVLRTLNRGQIYATFRIKSY